ncbi:probable ATP-dependent RNA helicase DDX27 [Cylas formicarius]|uniref:probable ATP-dependent RNA helicase DDX27 n=1 Tax=Cylas formicarius TaxID=197179 RepID=UPI002958B6FD|nr:probable ATP-dependent RNA helicase DDX27 [Cylas formicarius]
MATKLKDLVRISSDNEEVENFSEESDIDLDFQPSKKKKSASVDFDSHFSFVSSVKEYNQDVWNDVRKYIKRKAKSKTDDKIKKVRESANNDNNVKPSIDSDTEITIEDDELQHDKIRLKTLKNQSKEELSENVTNEDEGVNFYQMGLSRPLLKSLSDLKFVYPTQIQRSTIPVALAGRDICGCATTGTGKTAAYMLPTLERLLYKPAEGSSITRVLVLVPTRELGVQVYQVTKQLCQYTEIHLGLAVGGLDLKTQENVLRKNPDIVIATPGRLIDHLKSTPTFCLNFIEVLILDEADRMLDEFFAEQMKEIIKQCSTKRQTMLFSATMTSEVENLASLSLVEPVKIFVDDNKSVAFNLRQEFIRIRENKEDDREAILCALVCRTFKENCIIFVRTKKQAHRIHILLGLLGLKVAELHGNLTQPQRIEALEKFRNREVHILIATDVAARGLDIPDVQSVINYMMPYTVEQYIHRVGRTARAGRAGVSVSLANEQERKNVKEIIKKSKNPVKVRVIPPEIINKYRQRLSKLEPQIEQIFKEEEEERLIAKAEMQVKKAEKMIEGKKKEMKRPWFQTKQQRKKEKENLKSVNVNIVKKQKKNAEKFSKREVGKHKSKQKVSVKTKPEQKKNKKRKTFF